MEMERKATLLIAALTEQARRSGLVQDEDVPYCRNLLLDALRMDAPEGDFDIPEELPETATSLLQQLADIAHRRGLIGELPVDRELFGARLMGLLTPSPAEVRRAFEAHIAAGDPEGATGEFYQMCRSCDYIKVDAIAQNIRYFSQTPAGELEITINLSKPEKDPREIAKLKSLPSVGYPKCMLCLENPGYAGRRNFPARQNHRMIPLNLGGEKWYLQYSPYAYYPEHCIVLNSRHIPMHIDRSTFAHLFAFVGLLPHYMLGSNADLPIVGGSILNHDHFQGGRYVFPMDHAGVRTALSSPVPGVSACILDWPMSTVELRGSDPERLTEAAMAILDAWRTWSDPDCGILAREADGTPHNTITPILRREGDTYRLKLVLRNNRTTEEHPLGLFHPHAPLHHIKRENIGLIEVMGLFILPGRLKAELHSLLPWLTGAEPLARPDAADPREKHFDWVRDIISRCGLQPDEAAAEALLRQETALVCAEVLRDCGVYKDDETGRAGFLRFLRAVGYEAPIQTN